MAGRRRTRRNAGVDLRLSDGEALLLITVLSEYTVALTDEAEEAEDDAEYAEDYNRYLAKAKKYREMERYAKSVSAKIRAAGYSLKHAKKRWSESWM